MARTSGKSTVLASLLPCVVSWLLLSGASGNAQTGALSDQKVAKQDGPSIRTDNLSPPQNNVAAQSSDGPVRMARVGLVSGRAIWRPDGTTQWADATPNLPLREGAQVSVMDGGRAEIQFDDGGVLRLGNGAVMTLQTLYSDAEGEFTEIKLSAGLGTLRLKNVLSVYQFDTPLASIKAAGPAEFRLGLDTGLEVAVRLGQIAVDEPQVKRMLKAGDHLYQSDLNSAATLGRLPQEDSWDLWNDERDDLLDDVNRPSALHLPAGMALVAGDLDEYGTWHDDATYGYVWSPSVSGPEWRPYHAGHWTWVAPFGWTWVSSEPWGWVPYHYGTWVHLAYGWAWVPGPAQQYWCPAVVHFSKYGGQVAWCPLAPMEVRYPASSASGSRAAQLAALFSVGHVGVYYVADRISCIAHPLSNGLLNHTVGHSESHINSVMAATEPLLDRTGASAKTRGADPANSAFVPINAVRDAGGSVASSATDFASGGNYGDLPSGSSAYFTGGRSMAPPETDQSPVAGPGGVWPTPASAPPTRRGVQDVPFALSAERSVIAAPLPPQVLRGRPDIVANIVGAGNGASDLRSTPTTRNGILTLSSHPTTSGQQTALKQTVLKQTVLTVPSGSLISHSESGSQSTAASPTSATSVHTQSGTPSAPATTLHTATSTASAANAPRPATTTPSTGGSGGHTGATQH